MLIGPYDLYTASDPGWRQINPATVAALCHCLFKHLLAVNLKLDVFPIS